MEDSNWLWVVTVAVMAGTAIFSGLAVLSFWLARAEPARVDPDHPAGSTAFLFDDEALVDATPSARRLLGLAQRDGSPWVRLMQVLHARFPDVQDSLAELLDRGTLRIDSTDGRSQLLAEWRNGLARLQLIDLTEGDVSTDRLTLRTLEQELETLRSFAMRVPYLTWVESREGSVTWANAAYLDLADRMSEPTGLPGWPPPRVFPDSAESGTVRMSVRPAGAELRWYDLVQIPLESGRLRVATPADFAVAAERSRSEFLQTLTKTFATLSVGLAVFDRSRRLIMFNPALSDLTMIPAGFLVQRPSFNAFAEKLREARVLPEPKNFKTWREMMTRTVSQAEQGTYAETWTLPNNRVYEISGRPMPDGAISFLVQDVSDGMRLTRQFHTELKLHKAVLARLDQPMAVFTADGALFHANPAYAGLWGEMATPTLTAAQKLWQQSCPEAGGWDLHDDGMTRSYHGWLRDGRRVDLDLVPLPGGACLLRFTPGGSVAVTAARNRQNG